MELKTTLLRWEDDQKEKVFLLDIVYPAVNGVSSQTKKTERILFVNGVGRVMDKTIKDATKILATIRANRAMRSQNKKHPKHRYEIDRIRLMSKSEITNWLESGKPNRIAVNTANKQVATVQTNRITELEKQNQEMKAMLEKLLAQQGQNMAPPAPTTYTAPEGSDSEFVDALPSDTVDNSAALSVEMINLCGDDTEQLFELCNRFEIDPARKKTPQSLIKLLKANVKREVVNA